MKAKVSKTYMIIFSILTSVATAISVSGCGEQLSSVTGSTAAVTSATEAEQTTPAAVTTQASTEAAKSKRLSEVAVTVDKLKKAREMTERFFRMAAYLGMSFATNSDASPLLGKGGPVHTHCPEKGSGALKEKSTVH